ncbi:hypothetical protein HPB51_014992 [Rhipicephalus microplus]|uniref:Uncharacterized protein n=1 Tax=Rhipicephalus microplus TaxID=6941 RepID=A0A9J6DH25_RHIMP|nr:hypothetical protein HPB51_014992 [Rhipicephalus microplus]
MPAAQSCPAASHSCWLLLADKDKRSTNARGKNRRGGSPDVNSTVGELLHRWDCLTRFGRRQTCLAAHLRGRFKVNARPLAAGAGASAQRENRWRHCRASFSARRPRRTAAQTSSWRTVRDCKHGHGAGQASSYYFQRSPFPRTPSLTGFPMTSALKVVCKSVAFCAAATTERRGGACVVCMCATTR